MDKRQRTKRRAQRWARRRSLPSERARIARRRRWLQPHLVTFPALNMDGAHITHIGDVPLAAPIPMHTVEPIPARDISAQLGGMRRRDNTYDSFPHDQAQYGAQRNP